MNLRILLKSFRLAFRSKRRVFAFIIIYAILYVAVGKQLQTASQDQLFWLLMAFTVATVYAILISQFRRRDIAILKCVSWANSEIMLLLIGEVVIVAFVAFLLVFQLSVEILGLAGYIYGNMYYGVFGQLSEILIIEPIPMFVTLFYIVILQLPGLGLAQWRAMRIPPMRALREE